MVRRSPWLDERAALLVKILAEKHGLQLGEDTAREAVSDGLNRVAEAMRIGRQAAKMYVTDQVIDDHANRIATEVRRQQADPKRNHLRPVD
jgi:hypothetical protein